jgi:hypothetical protein
LSNDVRIFAERLTNSIKNSSEENHKPARESKPEPPEYETRAAAYYKAIHLVDEDELSVSAAR